MDAEIDARIEDSLRSYDDARQYAPNRVFIGELSPNALNTLEMPWFNRRVTDPIHSNLDAFGEIISQDAFYSLLKQADIQHPPLFELNATLEGGKEVRADSRSLLITTGDQQVGWLHPDDRAEGRGDENLSAPHLLEALCTKASGAHALRTLVKRAGLGADQIDYVISCGEEACGDRYQRGGGGMAKAIGEMCGCVNASGMDVKNFCAAPASALVTAGAFVKAGVYERIAVVAGGSLAKLGMKFQAFLRDGVPILDDCLASMAFLVEANDGQSPILHLERGSIGLASIGSSVSDEAVYRKLIVEPLDVLGLKMTDVDKYAPELHNPEIMQNAGSGDVAKKNYRMIAAMAVRSGLIEKAEMATFIDRIGMPGFAPTQGHIPSAVPFIGHAARAMSVGKMERAMFLCKASLFLNRVTELFDGVSFVLEKNPNCS